MQHFYSRNAIYIAVCFILLTSCEKIHSTSNEIPIKVQISEIETKGSVVTNDNIASIYGSFVMDGWIDDDYIAMVDGEKVTYTDRHYFTPTAVMNNGGGWELATERYWVSGAKQRFWSHAPSSASGLVINNSDLTGSDQIQFSYTSPTDLAAQKDIIFAYNERTYHHGESEVMDIHFFHALSQVKFAVSDDDETYATGDAGYDIMSIAIKDAPSYGEAVFDGTAANTSKGVPKGPHGYTWNNQGQPAYFENNCGNWDDSNWALTSYELAGDSKNLYVTKDVFFMIPCSGTRYVEVVFKRNADSRIIVKDIEINDEWKAGEYYTYKIGAESITSDVQFSISLLPWDYQIEDVNYHKVATNDGGTMSFVNGTYYSNPRKPLELTIRDGQPIQASFSLKTPVDGVVHISLSGYIGAFEIINLVNGTIDGNSITSFEIRPIVANPKIDYTAELHVLVTFKDGKTINADDVLMPNGSYKIILPAI